MSQFLTTFLTPTEKSVFAKRLEILWLLNQGMSYEAISKQLKVSSATISAVAEMKKLKGIQLATKKLQFAHWYTKLSRAFKAQSPAHEEES